MDFANLKLGGRNVIDVKSSYAIIIIESGCNVRAQSFNQKSFPFLEYVLSEKIVRGQSSIGGERG